MLTALTEQSVSPAPENCSEVLRRCGRGILLATDFPPVLGGISNYLFNVYRQFDLRQMTLIAPEHPDAARFDSDQAYAAKRFPTALNFPGVRGAWQVWQMYREAERLVKRNRHTVLHCGHVNAAVAARKLKRRYGTPYLLWTHALEIMDEWLRGTILPAMLDADLVITNSEFTRSFLAMVGVPRARIVKIRPGVDPEHFRPGLDCRKLAERLGVLGRPTLLTVSRMVKANRYKGHDVVLNALVRVAKKIPDVAYLIVGEGDDVGYLEQRARERGVRENVIFTGRVSDEELPLLYNLCDAFVLCSREERGRRGVLAEGFGMVFVEASACGKPVIAGRSGGVPDAVLDGVTGLLVDPVDSEAVATAIVKVLRDRESAKQLGTNGRRWVETEMNWTRAADEFAQAMERFFPQVVDGDVFPGVVVTRDTEAV
jgi:phosphatidyl-myo-inositol dimannoside synthase